MIKTAIVIPIYKEIPSEFEMTSFKRCLKVFRDMDIFIICPESLELGNYNDVAFHNHTILNIEKFESVFFKSIEGYNQLMMDLSFYKRFQNWDYILIYQLDAYVFENKLDNWTNKGYDYIGAPWFENYTCKEVGADLWAVGNGGFSLRKVQSFISVLASKKPIKNYKQLQNDYNYNNYNILKRLIIPLVILIRSFGYKNKINYWKEQCGVNEDFFWTLYLDNLGIGLKRPTVNDAVKFAFDQSPEYLYNLNNKQLPFGCHAWYRYEYESFWKKLIENEK